MVRRLSDQMSERGFSRSIILPYGLIYSVKYQAIRLRCIDIKIRTNQDEK